jgi:hypothetical protein
MAQEAKHVGTVRCPVQRPGERGTIEDLPLIYVGGRPYALVFHQEDTETAGRVLRVQLDPQYLKAVPAHGPDRYTYEGPELVPGRSSLQ